MKLYTGRNNANDNEHDDDIPVGRVLSRREMMALLAGAGTSILLAGCGATQISSAITSTQAAATATSQPTTAAAQAQATSAATATATQASATAISQPTTITTQAASATSASSVATTQVATSTGGGTLPSCIVLPQLTEGPYFVDEKLNRSDIRSDPTDGTVKAGVALKIAFNVSQVASGGCTPYAGAIVDIWQCDAAGTYSDVVDNGVGFNTKGKKFLRGYQVADANGKAEFLTIYPGWYQGRTVHIHFKVRSSLNSAQYTFSSQLFFDDTLSDQIFTLAPYASKGQRNTKNSNDSIYRSGGSQLLLKPVKDGDGYAATFNIGLQKA